METAEHPLAGVDRVGQALSLLCMAHCLLTPLLLAAVPVAGLSLFEHPLVHWGFAALALAAGGRAFVPGYRRHRRRDVLALAVGGMTLLVLARTVGAQLGEAAEAGGTVLGGAALVVAHARNRAHCRA
jgi:hypothetical protein